MSIPTPPSATTNSIPDPFFDKGQPPPRALRDYGLPDAIVQFAFDDVDTDPNLSLNQNRNPAVFEGRLI
jgi:hypothetical protein